MTAYFLLGASGAGTQRYIHPVVALTTPTMQCGPCVRGQLGAAAGLEPSSQPGPVHISLAVVLKEFQSLLSVQCAPWVGLGLWEQGPKKFLEPGYSERFVDLRPAVWSADCWGCALSPRLRPRS